MGSPTARLLVRKPFARGGYCSPANRTASGHWFRSYGNENWEFDEHGLMRLRIASINDLPIKESERKYHWALGRRPDGHQVSAISVCKSRASSAQLRPTRTARSVGLFGAHAD